MCAYMKKGPNLRWSLIQCSGGDEGDRTPDLLTASQALSQLSYAPVRRSTIRELGQRCKDNFGKTFRGRAAGAGAAIPNSAHGARPVGGGAAAACLPGIRPSAARRTTFPSFLRCDQPRRLGFFASDDHDIASGSDSPQSPAAKLCRFTTIKLGCATTLNF